MFKLLLINIAKVKAVLVKNTGVKFLFIFSIYTQAKWQRQ